LRELRDFSHSAISELNLPDSVELIGRCSFRPCRNLRVVRLGEHSRLRRVGCPFKHAFVGYFERHLRSRRREVGVVAGGWRPAGGEDDLLVALDPPTSSDDERCAKSMEDRD
jgi:hypothetical protein